MQAMGAPSSPMMTQAARVSLARCHLGDDRDIGLAAAWALLSAPETARARRFHFDRDRHRYVRARGFLRSLLGQATARDAADLVLAEGPWGKPFLPDHKLWFNLSHSRDLAVLAMSQHEPVGVDLEFIDRKIYSPALAQTVFCPQEIDALNAVPPPDRVARFFAFWTAKEARMKLTGEGLGLAPQTIALNLVAGVPVGYLRPKEPVAQAVFVDIGHPGAICCLALAQGPRPNLTFLNTAFLLKKHVHDVVG